MAVYEKAAISLHQNKYKNYIKTKYSQNTFIIYAYALYLTISKYVSTDINTKFFSEV